MSTTLTNGLKLPDKGSVDWYADMQNNYQILDGAVGTVAEHTTALAGKAPAVHTHTKSDVTDLFNSANTWTGDNTFSKTVAIERSTDTGNFLALKNTVAELGSTPASATPVTIAYRDKNDENLGYMGVYYDTDGSNHFRLYVRNKFTSGAPSTSGSYDYAFFGLRLNADKSKEGIIRATFRPYDNNTYDLGSSSYQWNNVYAKNYYYNGVAWGLDKANTWSNVNTYQREICISGDRDAYITPMWESASSGIAFLNSDATKTFIFGQHTTDANNRKVVDGTKGRLLIRTGERNGETVIDFEPRASNATLGTSTSKWKTLNGVNPGALSLPDTYTNIDTTNWDLTGTLFNYTPPIDGWLFVNIRPNNNYAYVALEYSNIRNNSESTTGKNAMACIAVRANTLVNITLSGASIAQARLAKCAGNV